MRIEIQWNSLFPLSMPYVTTLQYREIFWQTGSLLYGSDTAKQEFFMRLQLRLQSLHKHHFISNQLLFYCWLTQHFNFSISFSFKSIHNDIAFMSMYMTDTIAHLREMSFSRVASFCQNAAAYPYSYNPNPKKCSDGNWPGDYCPPMLSMLHTTLNRYSLVMTQFMLSLFANTNIWNVISLLFCFNCMF